MRKLLASILLLLPLLLISCNDEISTGRTILISVASDYMDTKVNKLANPLNDQAAIVGQIDALTKGDVELYLFRAEEGTRYVSHSVPGADYLFKYGEENLVENPAKPNRKKIKMNKANWNSLVGFDFQTVADTIKGLNAGKNDLIIFHYSGHGVVDGTLKLSLENGPEDWMGDVNLIELMTSYNKDAKKVVILDSCFSGSFIKDGILSSSNNFVTVGSTEQYKNESFFKALAGCFKSINGKDTYGTPNVYIIAAATKIQTANDYSLYSADRNHEDFGLLTFHVIKALGFDSYSMRPAETSKRITFYSLFKEVWDTMPKNDKKSFTPQATLSPLDIVLF